MPVRIWGLSEACIGLLLKAVPREGVKPVSTTAVAGSCAVAIEVGEGLNWFASEVSPLSFAGMGASVITAGNSGSIEQPSPSLASPAIIGKHFEACLCKSLVRSGVPYRLLAFLPLLLEDP